MSLQRKSKWQKQSKKTKEQGTHEKRTQSWATLFGQSDNHKAENKKVEHKKTMTVRDKVKARDHNRCQFPGCCRQATSLHHILFRSREPGRKSDEQNLVCLCQDHHTGQCGPHQSEAWRRYWEGWSEELYPSYWKEVRERA